MKGRDIFDIIILSFIVIMMVLVATMAINVWFNPDFISYLGGFCD